uniref:OCIA domain-containing protein 2 isoform X2 n=1 Tax=Ictidomys tridecemlineatus TaxID=43179 RepID=UPI001A9FB900|nr:OCIA domain-containing protein 2 isoform X2 [Ictidomys tridecemlineatus]XP_040148377.1 OCIA domain-containing protein 2 isoform X2 [Ictidomys tridecemlineatus]
MVTTIHTDTYYKEPEKEQWQNQQILLFTEEATLSLILRAEHVVLSKIKTAHPQRRDSQDYSRMSRRKFLEESMLVTQGLVHQGYLAANPRLGSLPKLALAGILGFGLGKASYIGVCQSKFHSFEDQLRGAGFGPEHNRHCLLTCEECKIRHGLSEKGDSQPSAS